MKDQPQLIVEDSFSERQSRRCRWACPKSAVFAIGCLWVVTTVQAVVPPPDGGYAGGNTAEGTQSLFNLLAGAVNNTAIGYRALFNDTTGNNNTGIGAVVLFANTTGASNTAAGFRTLVANTTGSDNTGNGFEALTHNTVGMQNTGIGNLALANNTTGNFNTALGTFALGNNTTGTSNIGVGDGSGFNLTTGSFNIDIGNAGVGGEAATIRIGTAQTNTYVAGIYGAMVPFAPMPVFCGTDGHLGTMPSSARFKDNIKAMDDASEAILALKPVTFRYKQALDSSGIPQFGLVAEQVEKVNPDLVVHDDKGKPYSVRYEAVNAMLLNEFLKEHRQVGELKAAAAHQQLINAEQQKAISTLTTALKEQTEQIRKVSAQLEANKAPTRPVANQL